MLLSIIIPVYNEEENITCLYNALQQTLAGIAYRYEIIFVNDGSTDNTLQVLQQLANTAPQVFYLSFSRNFGHQNAIKAGLDYARGNAVISMDGDMQHPPQIILQLITEWENGYDIVYTIRTSTDKAGFIKKKTSGGFYKILNGLSDIEVEEGTADFRLIDEKVLPSLRGLNEADFFWRGLVKWVGFKQKAIQYKAEKRHSGTTKYSFKKMRQLAVKGVTSFSSKPLNLAIYLGFTFVAISVMYIPYIMYSFFTGHTVSGWTSVIITIVFFGGINLLILGLMGIYIGKLFMQAKDRPHYIIRETNLK